MVVLSCCILPIFFTKKYLSHLTLFYPIVQWFKSYGHFTEGVDFVYWWSFSSGGSAINKATPSSFPLFDLLLDRNWVMGGEGVDHVPTVLGIFVPLNLAKSQILCKLAQNFSKCQRL